MIPTKWLATGIRKDTYQTLKTTLNYRVSSDFRMNVSASGIKNDSSGFQDSIQQAQRQTLTNKLKHRLEPPSGGLRLFHGII